MRLCAKPGGGAAQGNGENARGRRDLQYCFYAVLIQHKRHHVTWCNVQCSCSECVGVCECMGLGFETCFQWSVGPSLCFRRSKFPTRELRETITLDCRRLRSNSVGEVARAYTPLGVLRGRCRSLWVESPEVLSAQIPSTILELMPQMMWNQHHPGAGKAESRSGILQGQIGGIVRLRCSGTIKFDFSALFWRFNPSKSWDAGPGGMYV